MTVTDSPIASKVGATVSMVGLVAAGSTMKFTALLAVALPTVIAIGPVVAPEGTTTVSSVLLAVDTVAATPLKLTAFWLAIALKP